MGRKGEAMNNEKKESIEEVQDSFKKQLQSQLRTSLIEEKHSKLNCVLLITNEVTGRLDIISANAGLNLINNVKGMLYAAIDQLNRIQMTNAITAFMVNKKEEEKNDNVQ